MSWLKGSDSTVKAACYGEEKSIIWTLNYAATQHLNQQQPSAMLLTLYNNDGHCVSHIPRHLMKTSGFFFHFLVWNWNLHKKKEEKNMSRWCCLKPSKTVLHKGQNNQLGKKHMKHLMIHLYQHYIWSYSFIIFSLSFVILWQVIVPLQ